MQRARSHDTVCEDFAPLHEMGALDKTTRSERRIRTLEDFLLRAVVTASYGGAWLLDALMRATRRACAVLADQGESFSRSRGRR